MALPELLPSAGPGRNCNSETLVALHPNPTPPLKKIKIFVFEWWVLLFSFLQMMGIILLPAHALFAHIDVILIREEC